MTLPALTKTYEINSNTTGGINTNTNEDHQRTMFALKEALIGNGSGEIVTAPMTVSRSSDSVTADATDNWGAFTDCVWSTGNHSWIVLKSGGSVGFEVCIACDVLNYRDVSKISISPSGAFTGGTISVAPTATDEFEMIGLNQPWCGDITQGFISKVQVMVSTDGDVIMAAVFVNNNVTTMWRFDVIADPVPGWTDGIHYWVEGHSTSSTSLMDATFVQLSDGKKLEDAGTDYLTLFAYEAINVSELRTGISLSVPNDFDSAWPMSPVGLWSTVVGARGKLGHLTDAWWVHTTLDEGAHFPELGTTRQFAVFGGMAFPWDSSTVMQTG